MSEDQNQDQQQHPETPQSVESMQEEISKLKDQNENLKTDIDALRNQNVSGLTAEEIANRKKIEDKKKADREREDYFAKRSDKVEQKEEDKSEKEDSKSKDKIKVE